MSKSLRTSYAALRDQFGPAGLVLSVLAIVLALGGGAYAANGGGSHATASKAKALTKAQVLALIKANSKPGPAGPAGANGTNGTSGALGKEGPKGEQGPKGEPGNPASYPETLPPGKTETGVWSDYGSGVISNAPIGVDIKAGITYPIPLTPFFPEENFNNPVGIQEGQARFVTTQQQEHGGNGEGCTGTIKFPTAAPGWLCVYEAHTQSLVGPSHHFSEVHKRQAQGFGGSFEEASPWGFLVYLEGPEGAEGEAQIIEGEGTWAVTAYNQVP